MAKKKEQVLYIMAGAVLFGTAIYLINQFIWSLFFLLLISYLITLKLSNESQSFRRQMLSVSIGIFFFGLLSLFLMLIVKGFVMYGIELLN